MTNKGRRIFKLFKKLAQKNMMQYMYSMFFQTLTIVNWEITTLEENI